MNDEYGRILLDVRGEHRDVAQRAQVRAFRQAWRNGTFRLTSRLKSGRGRELLFAVLGLGALAAFLVYFGPPALLLWCNDLDVPLDPRSHLLARWLILGTLFIVGCLLLPWLYMASRLLWMPNVTQIDLEQRQFTAWLRDGSCVTVPWSVVEDIGGTRLLAHIRFQPGPNLLMMEPDRRTHVAMRTIWTLLRPDYQKTQERAMKWMWLRLSVIWLIGGAVFGWVVWKMSPPESGFRGPNALSFGVWLAVCWILIAVLAWFQVHWAMVGPRRMRVWARRGRRSARTKSVSSAS